MTEPAPTSERNEKEDGALVAGKYRVIKLLGRGGMGAVYEVEHVGVKRRFALKVMTRDVSEQKDAVRRFTQEAQAAARIGSPNIVDVFDLGEDTDGSLYMVMELLRGRTLHDVDEKMPIRRAVGVTCELLSALSSAHQHGIVHRDVKPQNLFLAEKTGSSQPVLKVLDFGIAKFREQGDDGTVSDHTKSGVVVGTPLYMAPEQVMGGEIDGRVDVWAAGATLFEMLTGRSVHLAPNATAAAVRVVTEKAPRVDTLRKDVDAALADIVEKSLAIERDDRFASADEMKQALEAYLKRETAGSGARPATEAVESARTQGDAAEPKSERKAVAGRSAMWLVGLGAFALGVGVVALLATKTTTPTSTSTSTSTTTMTSTTTSTTTSTSTMTSTTTSTGSQAVSPSPSASPSTSPQPSTSPSASSSSPSPQPSSRPQPAPPPKKPDCPAGQVSSDGHCCLTGHVWESGRCVRPMATSFP